MAAVDPFWLRDRVGPGLDNDPDELIRAAGMAEKLDGRRSPARTVDDPGESGAIKSIRAYQRPRGLKPDGLMNPNGPTVQRMTAELYERGGPRRRIPARGGTVPLWGPVGSGGDNDPRDLAATRHALFLAGLPVRGTDAETPLRRFQQMHGLAVDGRMEPFGPTHDMLDRITAPKLAALAGDDPDRPLAFRPREPELVGRVLRDRPTTIRTFFQEPDTLPSEAQQAAAVSLAAMNTEDAAIQAQWRALAGSEGDDLLVGGEGEDGLEKTPGRDSFSGVEPPPNPVAMVRQRLEQSGVPLTPRQLDQAAREAVSDGVDLGSDADLRILAETVRRTFHDHYQDLEKDLESGRMDIADVEDRLAVLTRDRVTALGNEERRRRIAATTEFLADQYIARARAEGIEIDAEAARARVARIVEAATEEDGIDLETLGDVLWATLDFIPVAGELKSGYEAVDLYSQILDKLEKDLNADVTGLYTDLSLAIFGAVPFLGKVVKGVKLGEKVQSAIDKAKLIGTGGKRHHDRMLKKLDYLKSVDRKGESKTVGEKRLERMRNTGIGEALDQQYALRKVARIMRQKAKDGPSFSIVEAGKYSPELQGLSMKRLQHIQNKLNPALTGTTSQVYWRSLLGRGDLAQLDEKGEQLFSMRYQGPGDLKLRIYDAVMEAEVGHRFKGLWKQPLELPREEKWAIDLKTGKHASLTDDQQATDDLVNAGSGNLVIGQPTDTFKGYPPGRDAGPVLGKAIEVNMKITDIPKDRYMATMYQLLKEDGLPDEAIAGALQHVDIMYRLDSKLLERITVGAAVSAAAVAAWSAFEESEE